MKNHGVSVGFRRFSVNLSGSEGDMESGLWFVPF